LEVNGKTYDSAVVPGTYVPVRRTWHRGDVVTLNLPMTVRQVEAHPYALENTGRAALMRGPLVYCLEGVDNPGIDLRDVALPSSAEFAAGPHRGLSGEPIALRFAARLAPPDAGWAGRLYCASRGGGLQVADQHIVCTAIPYYAWANREPGPMQVWLQRG
jgi:DUF1680 family protein